MTLPKQFSERVAAQIEPLIPARSRILVGLSGGVDSVVLLHLFSQLAPRYSWRISALHVHHGISPNADAWEQFCTELCASFSIPLVIEQVDITPFRAYGIEAAARKLRHEAFVKQPSDVVVLAHHADDQSETLLLQLLRGAGVRGASAMPFFVKRDGLPDLLRPLLHCTRQEILAYAAEQQLQWIEDESNADNYYPRNFLRHRIFPLLGEKFPAYRDTLARSAQHFAEASSLLNELAEQDAALAVEGESIDISFLKSLGQPRAKNLLRYFIHRRGIAMPQAAQLDDMLQQICCASEDAEVNVTFGEWQVMRYRGRAYVMPTLGGYDKNSVLYWHGEAKIDWPSLKVRLDFDRTKGVGISLVKLQRFHVTLRFRQGGETLRPHKNGPTRTLKNLLQEQHIPPWHRNRLPLLYSGEHLVCVLGVAIAADYQAVESEEGVVLEFSG